MMVGTRAMSLSHHTQSIHCSRTRLTSNYHDGEKRKVHQKSCEFAFNFLPNSYSLAFDIAQENHNKQSYYHISCDFYCCVLRS